MRFSQARCDACGIKCCRPKTAALSPAVKILGDLTDGRHVRHLLANGVAQPGSTAAIQMDLLTGVLHEMGHFDGWTGLAPTTHPDALMALTLGTGQRRIQDIDAVFAAGL